MSEYTPTESDVRAEWVYSAQDVDMDGNVVVSFDEALAQFDRFIARVKAEAVAGAQKELADLREENDRLERILQTPLSLKDLQVAWEAAEQADECREGDVLIIRDDEDNYLVRRMDDRSRLDSTARILSRAPKPREPWQDLADDLQGTPTLGTTGQLAEALYALGWRKGGDE